jgi:hypothetical protein
VTVGQAPGRSTSGEPSLAHANLQHWLDFFCSSAVTEASLGVIQPLSAEEACGFLGCMVVEIGKPELENLDVMEAASGHSMAALSGRCAPARWSSCRATLISPSSCCWRCWAEQRSRAWTGEG